MSLVAIKNLMTSGVSRQVLTAQKHSPVLLLGVGVVGFGTTVFLACKATLKVDEVLREAEKKTEQIALAKENHSDKYSEEDAAKDGLTARVQLSIKIARLYAPAVGVGVLTLAAITGSHYILTSRNVALTAAAGGLQKAFAEYRGRVKAELGEEKDLEFRHGVETVTIGVETDEGIAERTIKRVPRNTMPSEYARWFDEQSPNWEDSVSANRAFIRMQQNFLNDRLEAKGHVTLNDAYDALGIPRSKAGMVVGWVLNNPNGTDGHIDLGLYNPRDSDARAFINELNGPGGDAILLDPNVDGVIFDLMKDTEE